MSLLLCSSDSLAEICLTGLGFSFTQSTKFSLRKISSGVERLFFVPRPLCFTGFHMVVLTMQNLLSSPVRRHLIPSKSISKSLELSEWLTMVRIHWHSSEQNDCLNVYLQGLGKGRQIATRQVYLLLLTLRMIGGSTTFICRLFAETRSIVIRKKVTI